MTFIRGKHCLVITDESDSPLITFNMLTKALCNITRYF